ncbi:MAG: serine/threonine protein kinase [Deltaproteobacteria bacterium]|nr:serine/threonine protein kinase [Deltaproteobacteria bacterium]
MEHPVEIAEGSMFGRYRVVRQIGRGGMGAVYEAVHSDLEKRVALKVLLPSTASQTELVARFEREARAAARVRHPNVVDVSDVGVEAGVAWLVMEHLEGEDLSGLLRREGALPLARVAELMLPVLGAVEAAHSLGVVHRDLKPENIFLARMGDGTIVPKVLDFGISKMAPAGGGPALTSTGIMMGTPCYMSPEQAQSSRGVDGRSDQFSIGVILYECATGRRPFEGETFFSILTAIVEGRYTRPRELCPGLPERFEAMVVRALERSPDARFPSVAALAEELRACSSEVPAAVPAPVPAPTPTPTVAMADTMAAVAIPLAPSSEERRRGQRVGLVLLAAMLLVLTGAVALTRHGGGEAEPTATTTTAATLLSPEDAGAAAVAPRAAVSPVEEASAALSEAMPPGRGRGHGHGRGHRGRRRHDDD